MITIKKFLHIIISYSTDSLLINTVILIFTTIIIKEIFK